jgi:hypothetical protein
MVVNASSAKTKRLLAVLLNQFPENRGIVPSPLDVP